jgi:hypothetical protein
METKGLFERKFIDQAKALAVMAAVHSESLNDIPSGYGTAEIENAQVEFPTTRTSTQDELVRTIQRYAFGKALLTSIEGVLQRGAEDDAGNERFQQAIELLKDHTVIENHDGFMEVCTTITPHKALDIADACWSSLHRTTEASMKWSRPRGHEMRHELYELLERQAYCIHHCDAVCSRYVVMELWPMLQAFEGYCLNMNELRPLMSNAITHVETVLEMMDEYQAEHLSKTMKSFLTFKKFIVEKGVKIEPQALKEVDTEVRVAGPSLQDGVDDLLGHHDAWYAALHGMHSIFSAIQYEGAADIGAEEQEFEEWCKKPLKEQSTSKMPLLKIVIELIGQLKLLKKVTPYTYPHHEPSLQYFDPCDGIMSDYVKKETQVLLWCIQSPLAMATLEEHYNLKIVECLKHFHEKLHLQAMVFITPEQFEAIPSAEKFQKMCMTPHGQLAALGLETIGQGNSTQTKPIKPANYTHNQSLSILTQLLSHGFDLKFKFGTFQVLDAMLMPGALINSLVGFYASVEDVAISLSVSDHIAYNKDTPMTPKSSLNNIVADGISNVAVLLVAVRYRL